MMPGVWLSSTGRPARSKVRTLVLSGGDGGRMTYALLRRSGPRALGSYTPRDC